MALPLLPTDNFDFTTISREDMLIRLQRLANQVNPEWEDFSPNFPENILLENQAFLADLQRGLIEERARQAYWATVTDRLSAIRLGRVNGFLMSGAEAATLSGSFQLLSGTATYRIPIYAGQIVRTTVNGEEKTYRVLETEWMEVGQSSVDVNLLQSELISETFESSGEPNQQLLLGSTPYIDETATVSADSGDFEEGTTFVGATSSTRRFIVLVDDQGRPQIRFGNGINGAIPEGTISVSYEVGGGRSGEVEPNASWSIDGSIADEQGNAVAITFVNEEASSEAVDAMTVAEARVRGPQSLSVFERVVRPEDGEYVAMTVPGIARAFLATADNSPDVAENYGRLECVAYGTELDSGRFASATPTQAQLDAVAGKIAREGPYPVMMGFSVSVHAATLVDVDVDVLIYKDSNTTSGDVADNVREALKDFFAVALADRTENTEIDFGARLLDADGQPDYTIGWWKVFRAVLNAEGVRGISPNENNLLLNGAHNSVQLNAREFPTLGAVTIRDADQGGLVIS